MTSARSARDEVTSLGAAFLATSVNAVGEGGYARELTAEESAAQRAELSAAIAGFDIVITTAKVPGRRPPELVDCGDGRGDAQRIGRRGPRGKRPWRQRRRGDVPTRRRSPRNGVTLIGAGEIAREMAPAASDAYARNVAAVIAAIVTRRRRSSWTSPTRSSSALPRSAPATPRRCRHDPGTDGRTSACSCCRCSLALR